MGSTPQDQRLCWKRSALDLGDMCSTSRIIGALFGVFPIGSLPFKYYRCFPVNHDFVGRKGNFSIARSSLWIGYVWSAIYCKFLCLCAFISQVHSSKMIFWIDVRWNYSSKVHEIKSSSNLSKVADWIFQGDIFKLKIVCSHIFSPSSWEGKRSILLQPNLQAFQRWRFFFGETSAFFSRLKKPAGFCRE